MCVCRELTRAVQPEGRAVYSDNPHCINNAETVILVKISFWSLREYVSLSIPRWCFWSEAALLLRGGELEQPAEAEGRVHPSPRVGGRHQLLWQWVCFSGFTARSTEDHIYTHYRSKVMGHPDNLVFSMKTHTFIYQMKRKYSQDIDKVRNNDFYCKY